MSKPYGSYALILGIFFLLIGILGFISGLTPGGNLFGIFAVGPTHNVIHIITGLIGIWAAIIDEPKAGVGFAWYLLIAYGILTIVGFASVPLGTTGLIFSSIHINAPDNWLHLLVSISALAVVISYQRSPMAYR